MIDCGLNFISQRYRYYHKGGRSHTNTTTHLSSNKYKDRKEIQQNYRKKQQKAATTTPKKQHKNNVTTTTTNKQTNKIKAKNNKNKQINKTDKRNNNANQVYWFGLIKPERDIQKYLSIKGHMNT